MIKCRLGCFETNSSSCHSMIIGMEDEFKKWENDDLLYNRDTQRFCTKEEAINLLKTISWYKNRNIDFDTIDPAQLKEYLADEGFISCDWIDDDELNHDYNEFVTPKGEKICMLCRYGYDG